MPQHSGIIAKKWNLRQEWCKFKSQGNSSDLNIDAIVVSSNKTVIVVGDIHGAIHEAVGPGLLDKCKNLNSCETDKFKVSLGYKLLAKYVFHTVRSRDKSN